MTPLNRTLWRTLWRTLGLGWLGFLLMGLAIAWLFASPTVVVLVDRSYCTPAQWQQVVYSYEQLYHQHQQQSLQIKQVVLFSDLGQEVLSGPPVPEVIRAVRTYGRSNPLRSERMQTAYPKSQLLTCWGK
jgi:hypothetical protein